ncbi:MAG: minor capsid protein [Escherichia coli]|jgi:SPP1 gp7 family putative phage head morphogenesis protein|nr:minor capsid protein [Escherichia coli]
MANSDLGHKLTDKELAKLERRIAKLYRDAGEELQATIDAYFEQFAKRDEEMKALIGTVQNGKEWTEADYKQWRLNQIGRGERYQAMRDKVAQRATDANAVAVSYTNDATPGIYSLNRNYAAYTIERVTGNIGFDLWDEQTVKRLMVEQPDLMPYYPKDRALKRGIDLAYGKKQITASVTSSILQGKSIKHMADDLQKRITTMSRDSAIRTARTAVTGAQNAGRMDSYAAAEKMGIKLKKEWLATLDARTRHSHAMLDGEQVAQDKKFSNGCRFPGDPQGPPWEIYNCRCTLIAAVDGVDTSDGLRRTRDGLISDVTYAQWEASKQGYSGKQLSPYHMGSEKSAKDVTKKYIDSAKPRMGKVRYENGYRSKKHKEEINVANQIRELFGGKIVLLKESQTPGMKMPDMLWKGKQWEIKSISTEKAADSALRKAIKQIHGNQGGVIFDVADGIDKQKLIDVLDARATRSKSFNADIIALHNGSVLFVRRYKK